jgi:hypothetical protein
MRVLRGGWVESAHAFLKVDDAVCYLGEEVGEAAELVPRGAQGIVDHGPGS